MSRDWHTEFDMTDPSFGDEFDRISSDLVARCPAAQTVDGEYVISRYADVDRVLHEPDVFGSGTGIRGINYHPSEDELLRPNEMDPPEHTWLRQSWNRHFTGSAVAEHEPRVRAIIEGLVDEFIDDGHVELVSQYADPLACRTFCVAVANMPVEDTPFLQKTFQAALAGSSVEEQTENWGKCHAYMMQFLGRRRDEPRRDDIVDTILHFEYPDGRPYPPEARASSLVQVTAAGLVTTGAIVSGAIWHLAEHPEDRERLRSEPARYETAIEEFLRYFAAAPFLGRRIMQQTEVAGVELGPGDYIWYNAGGANRDPAVFDDPDVLKIDRAPNKHLSFAAGRHRCVGVHFARLNIRTALEVFLERVADFRVRPGFEPHYQGGMTRRMTALELDFEAAPVGAAGNGAAAAGTSLQHQG